MRGSDFNQGFGRRMFPFSFFFAFVFVVILSVWFLYGFAAFKAFDSITNECKDGLAKCAGRQVKQFNDGMGGK